MSTIFSAKTKSGIVEEGNSDDKPIFVSVSGLIGAGKTTLCKDLGKVTGMPVYHEPVTSNPFLEDFYREPTLHSFPVQVHFLVSRFAHHKQQIHAGMQHQGTGAIQDRSLHEDSVFALVQNRRGVMNDRLYDTYRLLFDTLAMQVPLPDVILHLDVPPKICLQRIRSRGRQMESNIDLEYLIELKTAYDEFFDGMAERTVVLSIDWKEFVDVGMLWNTRILPKLRTLKRHQSGNPPTGRHHLDMS